MRLLVLYGSQTGTSQDLAEQIWRDSKRFGYTGPVLPMDDYPLEQLITERLAIFVVATTGDGEEPDNMKKTWKFLLRRSLGTDSLNGLQFACLGLGDSSYEKFNYAAKKLNKRLQTLGATAICPIGLCDDQHDHGYSAVYLEWIKNLWLSLSKTMPLTHVERVLEAPVSKFHLTVLESSEVSTQVAHLKWPLKESKHEFVLQENKRTTSENHFQDVRLLRFSFPSGVKWQPGDIVQMHPCNSDEDVAAFFELVAEHNMDFSADTVVQLSTVYDDMPLPLAYEKPVRVGDIVKYIWDLKALPRQRFFELMSQNCLDELEYEKLAEFTTAECLEDLIAYVNRPRRTILEVLQDFRLATSDLTLSIFFELMPMIQARSFSIASCAESGSLDLLVAVVEYKTKLYKPRLGLCSNWLKDLSTGAVVFGAIRKGTMSLPTKLSTPLIMIGPGTGIAPFRSIIQSRLRNEGSTDTLIVYFGCRNKAKDFHFAEDFMTWQSGNRVQAFFAFSRDQEDKIYVQHRIQECKELLSELIREKSAFIYVAGSSNSMPKAVKDAFIEVLDGDTNYINDMIKARRYQQETWS